MELCLFCKYFPTFWETICGSGELFALGSACVRNDASTHVSACNLSCQVSWFFFTFLSIRQAHGPTVSLYSLRSRVAPRTSSGRGCAPRPPDHSIGSLDQNRVLPHGSVICPRSTVRFLGNGHGACGADIDVARSKLRNVKRCT